MYNIRIFFEFIFLITFFYFSKLIGLNLSSLLGGILFRVYGFFSSKNKLAYSNIKRVFPKLSDKLHLITFSDIAIRYLESYGYTPYECDTEDEARVKANELISKKQWPCYFFKSDTSGEKDFEEFFTEKEILDLKRFITVGIIKIELIQHYNF